MFTHTGWVVSWVSVAEHGEAIRSSQRHATTLGYTLFSVQQRDLLVDAGTNRIIESKSATAMWSHTGKATVLLTVGANAEPGIAALPITGELATSYSGTTRALSTIFLLLDFYKRAAGFCAAIAVAMVCLCVSVPTTVVRLSTRGKLLSYAEVLVACQRRSGHWRSFREQR